MKKLLGENAVLIFFTAYFMVGVLIFSNYGISWDEPISRMNGEVAYGYVFQNDQRLIAYHDRHYGTAFELPLVIFEKVLAVKTTHAAYLLRHFLTFLLFFGSVFVFYLMAKEKFSSAALGLLGAGFLVLSPRIFADSFYNSKDMPVLAFFILSIYTLMRFLKTPSWRSALLHATSSAFLIDIRLSGILAPLLTIFFFGKNKLANLFLYLELLLFFIYAFWPYLWADPLNNFIEAWKHMSRFSIWGGTVLYFGNYIKATELHWHYIPVWIFITTPILYLILFAIGFFSVFFKIFKNIKSPSEIYNTHKDDLIIFCWLFLPYLGYLFFRPGIYDGWRHFYFIYPAFLLVVLAGVKEIHTFAKPRVFSLLVILSAVSLFSVLWFMVQYHPYQNVYFNEFAGDMRTAKANFELDYWGLAFREGLEYIAKNDHDAKIPVFFAYGVSGNADILREEQKSRFTVVSDIASAKYILGNYRWHKNEYRADEVRGKRLLRFYDVKVEGVEIMSILKVRDEN